MNTPDNPLQHLVGLAPSIPTSPTPNPYTPRKPAIPIFPQTIIPKTTITTPVVPTLILPQPITTPTVPQLGLVQIPKPIINPTVPQVGLVQIPKPITNPMVPQLGLVQIPKPTTIPNQQVVNPITTLVIPQIGLQQIVKPIITKPVIPETNKKQWLNLKGQLFEELPLQWYNLRTGRFVSNKPGTYNPVYGLRGIRILGTREDLNSFWRLNSEKIQKDFLNVTRIEDIIFEPFEDIVFLSEDAAERSQVCFIGTAGTVIAATTTTDVASLTEKEMESMCKFTFGGLYVKGKIDNVIDGDTFDMVFYVPIALLGQGRALGDKKVQAPVIPMQGYEQTGFFAKVSIRMYGYDAAEKDTDAGKLAKRLMEEKFRSLGGIVWCQFIEATIADDKYGRTLAVLYEDEAKQRLLNNYLLEQEKFHNVKMVFPYIGGTKKQF